MKLLSNLFFFLGWISILLMGIGMVRPWVVLWWEATQNRKKAILYYGTSSVLFFFAYFLFGGK